MTDRYKTTTLVELAETHNAQGTTQYCDRIAEQNPHMHTIRTQ
jgi:hypothetical protein